MKKKVRKTRGGTFPTLREREWEKSRDLSNCDVRMKYPDKELV